MRRCEGCGLFGLRPLPTAAELERGYRAGYGPYLGPARHGADPRWKRFIRRAWHIYDGQPAVDRLPLRGPVLDVGAGEGFAVAYCIDRGIPATGVEPNSAAAGAAQTAGLPVIHGDINSTVLEAGAYRTILFNQVIEHLPQPDRALRRAHDLLSDDGTVILTTPNADGVPRRLFGTEWAHWHVPYHLHVFGPAQLTRLLIASGFSIDAIATVTPTSWIAMSFRLRLHSSQQSNWVLPHGTWQPRLAIRLFVGPFMRAVDMTRRGDCIVVVASKR